MSRFRTVVIGVVLVFVAAAAAAQPSDADEERLQEVLETLSSAQAELDTLRADGLLEMEAEDEVPALPEGWPDLSEFHTLPPIRSVVHPADRSVRLATSLLWHTTIRLPFDEQIVDYVVGDALYFDLRGADNMAYVKAMGTDRRTHISLVTDRDRTYSFDVFATDLVRPDEVLHVSWEPAATLVGGVAGAGGLVPGFTESFSLEFVPSRELDGFRRQIDAAFSDLSRIEEDAARQLSRIEDLSARRQAEFLRTYPRRVFPRYRLTPEIQAPPLLIHQIWTDDRFTYLRSTAGESPAIYTLSGEEGEEPVLVNVNLTPDGLYVIDHVVGAGFAQLHGARGEWHLWDLPPVSFLPDLVEAGLPREGPPVPWVPTRSQKSWIQRHPKLFATLVAGSLGGYLTLRLVL